MYDAKRPQHSSRSRRHHACNAIGPLFLAFPPIVLASNSANVIAVSSSYTGRMSCALVLDELGQLRKLSTGWLERESACPLSHRIVQILNVVMPAKSERRGVVMPP